MNRSKEELAQLAKDVIALNTPDKPTTGDLVRVIARNGSGLDFRHGKLATVVYCNGGEIEVQFDDGSYGRFWDFQLESL
jgi:hypothetical protein